MCVLLLDILIIIKMKNDWWYYCRVVCLKSGQSGWKSSQKSHRKYVEVRNKTDLISINETTKLFKKFEMESDGLIFNHYWILKSYLLHVFLEVHSSRVQSQILSIKKNGIGLFQDLICLSQEHCNRKYQSTHSLYCFTDFSFLLIFNVKWLLEIDRSGNSVE